MSNSSHRRWLVALLSVTAFIVIACGGRRLFDSTYTRHYTERELETSLREVPTTYAHVLPSGEKLTLVILFSDFDGEYSHRGYFDPPYYWDMDELNLSKRASTSSELEQGAAEHLDELGSLWLTQAHADIQPNMGNDISLTCDMSIAVDSANGERLLSATIEDATLIYGRGSSYTNLEQGASYPEEFLYLRGARELEGERLDVQVLIGRGGEQSALQIVPTTEQIARTGMPALTKAIPYAMVLHGQEVLYGHATPAGEAFGSEVKRWNLLPPASP